MNDAPTGPSEREIFPAALKIDDPAESALYLKQACGENVALLHKVEGLLKSIPNDSFLESPASDKMETVAEPASPDGNSISSVDSLGTIHIWRAPTWEEIEAMDAESGD